MATVEHGWFRPSRSVLDPQSIHLSPPAATPITSLAVSASVVYVGYLSGTLQSLPLASATSTTPKTLTISNGTPVISITPIQIVNKLLLILSDNSLFLLDCHLQSPIKKLGVLKVPGGGKITSISRQFVSQHNQNLLTSNGFSSGSTIRDNNDTASGGDVKFFFAIGVGKKLLLVEVNCSVGEFVVFKEITGVGLDKAGMIVSLTWVDDSVIVGSKSGYHLFSCKTGQCRLLFTLPEVESMPRMKLLRKEGQGRVILVVDNVGIVVDVEGQPMGGSLVFRGVPEGVGEAGMYVVVVRGGMVEIYHKKSGRCVQVILLGEALNGPYIVSEEDNGSGDFVALASGTKVLFFS